MVKLLVRSNCIRLRFGLEYAGGTPAAAWVVCFTVGFGDVTLGTCCCALLLPVGLTVAGTSLPILVLVALLRVDGFGELFCFVVLYVIPKLFPVTRFSGGFCAFFDTLLNSSSSSLGIMVGAVAAGALALAAETDVFDRTTGGTILSTGVSAVVRLLEDRFGNSKLFCALCSIDLVGGVADVDWLLEAVVVVSVAFTLGPALVLLIVIGMGREGIGEWPALFLV